MKNLPVFILVLIISINTITYFEVREVSMKMDGLQLIEDKEPTFVRSFIKWLI